ncbi:unnamed protein product [Blepharisma stoltei]|uniref:MIR domain-containing protein n=1 Tax=Blepharisma stoltei TaxID=1481888 RepID=A0AAU9IK84_9CILI|nr:unnamed protein product [Blepharisma stoltei]
MTENIEPTQYLHYGSFIKIKSPSNFYLYSLEFIEATPYLADLTNCESSIIGSIFQIIPQSQYSVQHEISKNLQNFQENPNPDKLEKLEDSLDAEIKVNSQIYKDFKGQPIKYGSIVQLQHTHSRRFLTLSSKESADLEKENFKITLGEFTSPDSHFRIEPSYKYQSEESGFVRLKDKILFEASISGISKIAYLHESKENIWRNPKIQRNYSIQELGKEINVSVDQETKWDIFLYAPFTNENFISCGDYIWLSRIEEGISLSTKAKDEVKTKVFFNENVRDPNSLWYIEGEDPMIGGLAEIKNSYRLKNAISGLYLGIGFKLEGFLSSYRIQLQSRDSPTCLWTFSSSNPENCAKFLIPGCGYKLVNAAIKDATIAGSIKKSSNNVVAFSPVIQCSPTELDYFKLTKASNEVVWESFFLLYSKPILKQFQSFFNCQKAEKNAQEFRVFERHMKAVVKCLNDLNLFCQNRLIRMVSFEDQFGEVHKARQNVLRDQKYLECLVSILNTIFIPKEYINKLEKVLPSDNSFIDEDSTLISKSYEIDLEETIEIKKIGLIKEVIKGCYTLIASICSENIENQTYASQFFHIFIKHVGLNLGATKCIYKIVKNNEKILMDFQEKAARSENIIYKCALLLKKNYVNKKPEILEFLKAVCVTKGNGVKINQEIVFQTIFSIPQIYRKVFIPISEFEGNLYLSLGQNRDEIVSLRSCFECEKIVSYNLDIIYFIKFLELLVCLCLGRNFVCSEALKDHFSTQILQNMIWDTNISRKLRAILCKLLLVIHIDSYPRQEPKKPNLIKILKLKGQSLDLPEVFTQNTEIKIDFVKNLKSRTEKRKTSMIAKIGEAAANMFKRKRLPTAILHFLEEEQVIIKDEKWIHEFSMQILNFFHSQMTNPSYDIFTFEMLRLGDKMVRFEIYGTYSIAEYENDSFENTNLDIKEMDITKFLRQTAYILFYQAEDKEAGRKANKQTAKKWSKNFFKKMLLSTLIRNQINFSDPLIGSASSLRNFLQQLKESASYNSKANYENKIKVQICKTMHYYLNLRQEFLISNVSGWFNNQSEVINQNLSNILADLLPNVMKITDLAGKLNIGRYLNEIYSKKMKYFRTPKVQDLNHLCKEKVLGKLWKIFTDSNNFKLQTHALKLIVRCFKQREELLIGIKKIVPISNSEDASLLRWLKSNLNRFKRNSEQCELWLNYWARNDNEKAKYLWRFDEVNNFLVDINSLFYGDTTIVRDEVSAGNKEKISRSRQDIMFYLGVHDLIIDLLKNGMRFLVKLHDSRDAEYIEPRDRITNLYMLCCEILRKFAYKHEKTQKYLYKYLHVFSQYLRINVNQIPLICEIFKNNEKLILSLNKETLKQFRKRIYEQGRRPEFLEFYEIIQMAKSKPIPKMQKLVVDIFFKEGINRFLLYMSDADELNFSFKTVEKSEPEYQDIPFDYHAKLFRVLSKANLGATGMYMNELKIQQLIKLSDLFQLLMKTEDKESEFPKLKIPLLEFLFNIYLSCENSAEDLSGIDLFLNYIKLQCKILQLIDIPDSDYIKFLDIWIRILYKYCAVNFDSRDFYLKKNDFVLIEEFSRILCGKQAKFYIKPIPDDLLKQIKSLCSKLNLNFEPNISEEKESQYWKINDKCDALNTVSDEIVYTLENYYQFTNLEKSSDWKTVRNWFIYNEKVKECLNQEQKALIASIVFANEINPELNFDIIVQSLINYIRKSKSNKCLIKLTADSIDLLGSILENPFYEPYDDHEQIKKNLQNKINDYGATKLALISMSEDNINQHLFFAFLKLLIQLLDGGNQNVQNGIYRYFVKSPSSEILFYHLQELFSDCIRNISQENEFFTRRVPVYKPKKQKILLILKFLQLLCDNHNNLLQNYIRHQEKSRNSYDMIDNMISLLSLLIKKLPAKYFQVISQCFDTLTELVQGPCKKNQERVIDSKFLEISSVLMSLDENSDEVCPYELFRQLQNDELALNDFKNYECCRGWMVSSLKYKCMIAIHSLLEGREDNYVISRLIRATDMEVFKENLRSIYHNFIKYYKKPLYDYTIFNHYLKNGEYQLGSSDNPQDRNPDYFRVIIETGFMIYHLMRYFQDNGDPEVQEKISEELPQKDSVEERPEFLGTKLIEGIGRFSATLLKDTFKTVTKLIKHDKNDPFIDEARSFDSAYNFFNQYTAHVEVYFNGKIRKVYFAMPPSFRAISEEIRSSFEIDADRSSDQAKLRYLIMISKELNQRIKSEYKIQLFLERYPIINAFTANIWIWRYLAFLISIILNFFIIASYSYYGDSNLFSPSLFYDFDTAYTLDLIKSIGLAHVTCSCLIFIIFFLKNAPVLAIKGWKKYFPSSGFWLKNPSKFKIGAVRLTQVICTVIMIIKDPNVYYYFAYWHISMLGEFLHPFWFSLLLFDVIYQFPSLKDIIQSVTVPIKPLLLTFIFMIAIEYIYSVAGFLYFSNWFDGYCETLWVCMLFVVEKGLIWSPGGYLSQPPGNKMDYGRLVYDNSFILIVSFCVMNVVLGLIIDAFAVLRYGRQKSLEDKNSKCFICGMERDWIERVTSKPFRCHTYYDHNEWNYILYIGYIQEKGYTECTGIESYVKAQIEKQEFLWIPRYMGLGFSEKSSTTFEESMSKTIESLSVISNELKITKEKLNNY